jgi:hypothetical protein
MSKLEALLKELRKVLQKHQVLLKHFQLLMDRLQHMAHILPSARSFFTPLNESLWGLPDFVGLGQQGEPRKALLDMGILIQDLAHQPAHVSELVAQDFAYIGFCDASTFGAGGMWFSGHNNQLVCMGPVRRIQAMHIISQSESLVPSPCSGSWQGSSEKAPMSIQS